MKRLAAFAIAAVFSGGAAFAGEVPAGPTTPQVPAPIIQNGLPMNQPFGHAPRSFSIANVFKKTSADAPVVAHPTPLPTGFVAPAPAACASPAACSVNDRGTCCDRLKRWLCFKPCPVHLPCTPTPCYAPAYEFFACKSNAGYAGGCAPGSGGAAGCAPGGGAAGGAATGRGLFARTPRDKDKCASDCDPRTGPVNPGLPGFRFAAPENPAVAGGASAAPHPVVNTSFKMPAYGTSPAGK